MADIEVFASSPDRVGAKKLSAEAGKKKGEAAPSEEDGSEIDLSEPIVADARTLPSASAAASPESDDPLRKAIEETNRRAMLASSGLASSGLASSGLASSGPANSGLSNSGLEPEGQDGSAEGRAKLEKNAAGQGFGFAPSFIVLAAALIVILAVKRARRAKPPIDPNKTN